LSLFDFGIVLVVGIVALFVRVVALIVGVERILIGGVLVERVFAHRIIKPCRITDPVRSRTEQTTHRIDNPAGQPAKSAQTAGSPTEIPKSTQTAGPATEIPQSAKAVGSRWYRWSIT
jgi:hypothetical protein